MEKYALITGASKGIGYEFAVELAKIGFNLILVARSKELLDSLAEKLNTKTIVIPCDLTKEECIYEMYDQIKDLDIDVFINNAGFGKCGSFLDIPYESEASMIDLNIKAFHLLLKLMCKKMDKGAILNVASVAGIMPAGPYMSTYYATKAYVRSLTMAVQYEMRHEKPDLYIGMLAPGPVDTNFNNEANVKFALKGISANACVKYTLKKMKKRKKLIIPSFKVRFVAKMSRFANQRMLIKMISKSQKSKIE